MANVLRVVYWLFVRLIIDPLSAVMLAVLMLPHIVAVWSLCVGPEPWHVLAFGSALAIRILLWQAGNAVRGDK